MQLGVFPLPVFLLPGGMTQLRIFEPRYLRLIKQASSGEGFALSVYQPIQPFQSHPIAAHVKLTDFTTLQDGLLGVSIKATQLVRLSTFQVESDQLRTAKASPLNHWSKQDLDSFNPLFTRALQQLFEAESWLTECYKQTDFHDPLWVCGRFLELLPLPLEQKLPFYQANSFPSACHLLETLLGVE